MALIAKLIKFGFVGGFAFCIDYGLLFLLKSILGVNVYLASTISFLVSLMVNYTLSMKFVFKVKEGMSVQKQGFIFFVTALIGLGITQVVMWFAIETLNLYYLLGRIIATVIVMVWNYITRHIFLEK